MKSFFCLFVLLLPLVCAAQHNSIGSSLGSAFYLNGKASGYQIGLEYQRKINSRGILGLEISQVYQDGRGILPDKLDGQGILLRDYTQHEPLGPNTSLFGWDESAFPALRLSSKPNRYYQFNMGVKFLRELLPQGDPHGWNVGLGAVFSYRDEMELIRLIPVRQLKFFLPNIELSQVLLPLFQFKTFFDIALAPEINYHFAAGSKCALGVRTQFFYYLASNDLFFNTSISFRISF